MSLFDLMAVDVPEGEHGSCSVRRFEVEEFSLTNLRLASDGRACKGGTYTGFYRGQRLWMSDTTAERNDHYDVARQIDNLGGRVLIGGLGIGMILRVALLTRDVTHVDVVEIDPDVIALVGPHYEKMAADQGKSLTIHEADLFEIKWPVGTRWDVAWFDIWPDLCADNLEGMSKLRRSYGRRTEWSDCWGREICLRQRRQFAASPWG